LLGLNVPSLHLTLKDIALAVEGIVAALALGACLVKDAGLKSRLVSLLLISCTVFVLLVMGQEAFNRNNQNKSLANQEMGMIEVFMRAYSLSLELQKHSMLSSSKVIAKSQKAGDEWGGKVLEMAAAAVKKEPLSPKFLMQQVVVCSVVGVPLAQPLAGLEKLTEPRAQEVNKLVRELYLSKAIEPSRVPQIEAGISKFTQPGYFRESLSMQLYKKAGMKARYEEVENQFGEKNFGLVLRMLLVLGLALLLGFTGCIVLLIALFRLSRNWGGAREDIATPVNYGFKTVYGVMIGWMTLTVASSPLLAEAVKLLKSGQSGPLVVALLTLFIYICNNVPALILVYLLAIKPNKLKFWEAARYTWRTGKAGPAKLIAFGLATWLCAIPLNVLVGVVTTKFLGQQASSNPVITILLDAVRSNDPMAALVFMFTLGVMPAICEETLFRGFLYPSLRWRFGPFVSMVISAVIFSSIHLDFAGTVPLFVLGFLFAFIYERTRSLVPSMIAHCCWNCSTFTLITVIFGMG
jgi:membrane protease YdiL (CAAX protease family)